MMVEGSLGEIRTGWAEAGSIADMDRVSAAGGEAGQQCIPRQTGRIDAQFSPPTV